MKWYRSKETLQAVLKQNEIDLETYRNIKICNLLQDESNLIKDHLELLDENEKLKKAIEIIKKKRVNLKLMFQEPNTLEAYNNYCLPIYKLTQQEYDLLKEVINNE